MFTGTINQDMRCMVAEITKQWNVDDIYIGCSGNFTIERLLKGQPFNLYSNDVSLYSTAIGNHVIGKKLDVWIKDDRFKWLEEYMQDSLSLVATLLLSTTMLDGYDREEPYFVRKRKAYHSQWKTLHQKTSDKLEVGLSDLSVRDYFAGDVLEFIRNTPNNQAFVSFPPTYKGGYEKLYEAIDNVFGWDEPHYEMFDDDSFQEMIDLMLQKKEWIISRDKEVPELEDYLVGTVQTSLRSKPVNMYANKAKTRITMPHQKTELLKIPRANEDTEITIDSTIGVQKITQGQMNTLRSLYLDPGIAPSGAMLNLAVLVDGKIVGAIGLSKAQFGSGAYLMTDFAIRPLKYRRMSKLILAIVLSEEVKLMIEQMINQRVRVITTTAFTDKPVSMKYRGIFELASRKEDPPRLNYDGEAGKWTMREGFEWWIKKHGKHKV